MVRIAVHRLGLVAIFLLVHFEHGVIARQAQSTVTKISVGPRGRIDNGTFVLDEERSVFSRTDDREVVALFQWSGTPGAHKLVAQWRSPDGGQTSNSAIDYMAREARFGAYWTLPLTPSTPLGAWSIEATVDGQPAGRFSFEVTDGKVSSAVIKRTLSEAELFARLNSIFLVLQRSSPSGKSMRATAGFVQGGAVYTALSAVDGTAQVRVVPDGRPPASVTSLMAWHRLQDWAAIPAGALTAPAVPVAAADATKVGDRCYSMEGGVTGGRALVTGTITGLRRAPDSLIAAFATGEAMTGAPVLNEFGELTGIVGGSGVPGAIREMDVMRFRAEMRGIPVTPWSAIRLRVDPTTVSLEDLRKSGELLAGVEGEDHIIEGGFARTMSKSEIRGPSQLRDDFSMREKSFSAFVAWLPRERLQGLLVWKLINSDGHTVTASTPQKTDIKKGSRSTSAWEIPMPQEQGVYRVEVTIGAALMWRGFVRITP